jgi:hypothetical protein
MFVKVFDQIFDSSIVEDYSIRHVFMDLLVLADRHGEIDMTAEAIARRTNVPLSKVKDAIEKLAAPDATSRTPDEEGRRLVLLDDHRDWGWRIVNYERYRDIRDEEARRAYFREYKRKQRGKHLSNFVQHVSTPVRDSPTLSTYTEADTEVEAEALVIKERVVVNPLAQSPNGLHAEAPPIGTLPCVGAKKSWPLYQAKVDEWQATYPGVNVVDSLRRARQWLVDNPAKRKTHKGMQRFLNAWLSREQNEGGRNATAASPRYDRSKQNQEAAKRAIDRIVGDSE